MKKAAIIIAAPFALPVAIAACFVVATPIVIVHMVIPSLKSAYIP